MATAHLSEGPAGQHCARSPAHAAEHVEHDEGAPRHVGHARHDRGEGPHDGDEPGQHDGPRPVAGEVVASQVEVTLTEEPGVGAAEQRGTHPPSEEVPHLIAGHRGHRAADHEGKQCQVALGGEQAGGEEQRVAGQEESGQQARLGEDDGQNPDRPEGFDQILGVHPGRVATGARLTLAPEPGKPLASWPNLS